MTRVACDGTSISLAPGETLLHGLLRSGVSVPHSCQAGACQSCLVRALAGAPPPKAQQGLKATVAARGYFLACQAVPEEDLTITLADGRPAVSAAVASIETLSSDVVRVRLATEQPLDYRAGQFVNLTRLADGLTRSYSLASRPETDDQLELHVRVLPSGRMSGWLADPGTVGATVRIRGPLGDCFYLPEAPEQPILLAGTGTGLAPLVGIAKDAIANGHAAAITLIHGARSPAGLYFVDELRDLARRHPGLSYVPCALEGPARGDIEIAPVDAVISARRPSLEGHRVFLCGDPGVVAGLRKKAFLAGARLADIHSDAFVPAPASAV